MNVSFSLLKPFLLVIFLFIDLQSSVAQDSSSSKVPMYYKLDSSSDSILAIGERSATVKPDSVTIYTDNSFPISGYIIIAIIFGAISTVAIASNRKKKEIEFKKWNLKNRENLRDDQK